MIRRLALAGALAATFAAHAGSANAATQSGCAFGPGIQATLMPCTMAGLMASVYTASCVPVDPIIRTTLTVPCGVIDLENLAYDIYADSHGLDRGDPRIPAAGQFEIAGILWGLFQTISYDVAAGDNAQDPGDLAAYHWLQDVVRGYQQNAAQFAIDEYNRWKGDQCGYVPPNPDAFNFRAVLDRACTATFASLLSGPKPPTYAELQAYGLYDEAKLVPLTSTPGSQWAQQLGREAIDQSAGNWAAFAAAPGLDLVQTLIPGLNGRLTEMLLPYSKRTRALRAERARMKAAKLGRGMRWAVAEEEHLITPEEIPSELADEGGFQLLEEAGVDLADAAAAEGESVADLSGQAIEGMLGAGTDALETAADGIGLSVAEAAGSAASVVGAGFFVAGIAAAIAVQEGTEVVRAEQLPGQLQANLDTASKAPVLADMLSESDGGAAFVLQLLESTFDGSRFTGGIGAIGTVSPHGFVSPPYHGDQIQISHVDGGGTTRYTERKPVVNLRSWPIGVEMGVRGMPFSSFAYDGGLLYRTPNPDEEKGGASGYYPTGELHYFDWTGHPHVAIVEGSQFLDLPSPGSDDLAGWDAGDFCAKTTECRPLTTLLALGPGDEKVRVTLKPDPGAPAIIGIDNVYGSPAGSGGGFVVGQTVQLIDPNANPNGVDTTYTWQVETRCAHGATCTPAGDPAFHGHPTTTLTGQTVRFTWPSAGTFHIRLTTEDSYGVKHVADEDVTVSDSAPRIMLSFTPPLAGSAFGPLREGDTATIGGCMLMPAGAYTTPTVSIDWGDGTAASQTSEGSTSGLGISFVNPPSGGCTSPWRFTATHEYTGFTTTHQDPVTLTVDDGLGKTVTYHLAANLQYLAAPSFSSPDHVTFTAGSTGTFRIRADGAPTPAVSLLSGSLPSGLGLFPHGDGTATLNGDANIDDGGTYPLTVRATSSEGNLDQTFTLTVDSAPRITSGASEIVAEGDLVSIPLTAVGYPAPTLSVSGGLPSGLSFSAGAISGTPGSGSAGTYNLLVKATSAAGVAQQAYTLTVGNTPAITSPATAPFVVGAAPSSFAITTSGYPTPALSLSGTLPSGLSFHDNGDGTASIFGSADGGATSATVTITATNAAGSAHQDLQVNASPTGGPSVTVDTGSLPAPRFAVGQESSYTVSSSDQAATLTVDGSLPNGVTFHDGGAGTATISGTPASGSGGYYSLVIKAHPGSGPDGLAFAQLEVLGPPAVTSPDTATFAVGTAGSFTVTTGGLPRAALSLHVGDAVPDGLAFHDNGDGTATISGTPAAVAAGSHAVTLEAENLLNLGHPAGSTLTIDVRQAPSVTSDAAIYLAAGVDASAAVTTSGAPAPALSVTGTLPDGVTFTDDADGTGTIAGTPTDTRITSYPVTIQATSTAGTTTQAATITVGARPAFVSEAVATFSAGHAGSFRVTTDGSPPGTPATTITALDPLPDGLTLTDNGDATATISGTPTGTGAATAVRIAATDGFGETEEDLLVEVEALPSYTGTDSALFTTGDRGGLNSWTLEASGYPAPALTLTGALPSGITFTDNGDGTGTISGLPADGSAGDFPLTLHMTSAAGTASQALSLHVTATARFTSSRDVTFVAGMPNTFTVTTDGHPAAATITLRGIGFTLPSWLTLTQTAGQETQGAATLSGTPPLDALGEEDLIPLLSQNGVPNGDLQDIDLRVSAVGFTRAAPPEGTVASGYSYAFGAAVAGGGPASFAVADGETAPPGLTLSPDGVLSGTPTTVGSWTFHVDASSGGESATTAVKVRVGPARHELEISEFRLAGPSGQSDWYAKVTNATGSTVSLSGWKLGVQMRSGATSKVALGPAVLAPGASRLVTGPFFSRDDRGAPAAVGAASVGLPGGFQVIAPNGTMVDRAGEAGAAAGFFAGTPLAEEAPIAGQGAYQRKLAGGVLVNTDDNAADFEFVTVGDTSAHDGAAAPPAGLNTTPSLPFFFPSAPTSVTISVTTAAGSLTLGSGDQEVTVRWSKGSFDRAGRLVASRTTIRSRKVSAAAQTPVVRLSARSRGKAVRSFDPPLDVIFPRLPSGARPAFSTDRTTWTEILRLRGSRLPARWRYGWYRDAKRRVHVLTRRAGSFALVTKHSRLTRALRLHAELTPTLALAGHAALRLRLAATLPATVVATLEHVGDSLARWRVAAAPGTKTHTLTLPAQARRPGRYVLRLRATAAGEAATARLPVRLTW